MIGSVYEYYLTTYARQDISKYDTHKKSELRAVYNNIVKLSKKSPLYKLDVSDHLQKYAIDIKENARAISKNSKILSIDDSDAVSSLKKAVSSDESVLSVRYLNNETNEETNAETNGNESQGSSNTSYTIEVQKLASPQINTGNFLPDSETSLSNGIHYFEVSIDNSSYEFQLKVNAGDHNRAVQEKLSSLINHSNIGIHAQILQSGNSSGIQIESNASGKTFTPLIFNISQSKEHPNDSIISELGIDKVSTEPANAEFLLNGMEKTSSSNNFTINKTLDVTLKGVSQNHEATSINFEEDFDSVLESVNNLIHTYNSITDLAVSNKDDTGDSSRLYKELRNTFLPYKNKLESVGIRSKENGDLDFDESILIQASKEGTLSEGLHKINEFKNALSSKADEISINPMKYVNKVMISYPNPVKSFANPYITSIYTGMMFNSYV